MRMTVDPQRLYISSCSPLARNPLDDYIREAIDVRTKALEEQYTADVLAYSVNDVISTSELTKMFKTEKETEKMEAKKCDRCGKLYEMPGVDECEGAEVRFKFMKVADAENKSETKIVKEQTRPIYIHKTSLCDRSSCVDLCPECRESLKKWFEEA